MLFKDVKRYNFSFLLLSLLICILVLPLINYFSFVTTALITQLALFQILLPIQ